MGDESLQRFLDAQGGPHGQSRALAELRAGAKTSHWIWYVFPQLRSLGRSVTALRYGLDGVAEAESYLRHPLLRTRLLEVAEAARGWLERGAAVEDLMGSSIDALKLVSSMTLFAGVAERLRREGVEGTERLAAVAAEILAAAGRQGLRPCAVTGVALAAAYGAPRPG
jgi:uncharacterized protein (DUF1810 family)